MFATGFLNGSFVIPRFVLDELQRLADSRDTIKGERGRRGLDCVKKLRETPGIDLSIHEDSQLDNQPVDTRLASLARELNARLLTNDVNLGKVAEVRGVTVLNFNDLTLALQPELCPGDEIGLSLVKPGKEKHQAVGYLPNGAMIVVNHAAQFLGETVPVVVSGTLQTSAGRMVFAELKPPGTASAQPMTARFVPATVREWRGSLRRFLLREIAQTLQHFTADLFKLRTLLLARQFRHRSS